MAYLYYLLNGFLALLWLSLDHILLLLLVFPLAWLAYTAPREQRPWTGSICALSLIASAVSPAPVSLFLLIMASAGFLAVQLERFNESALRWNLLRGVALYSLAGLGFAAFQDLAWHFEGSPLLAQGQGYLSTIASFAMYLIPLGYLALLAQSLFTHPPVMQKPADQIHTIRSRGKS